MYRKKEADGLNNVQIALAGNPNCGKTTVFNGLTNSREYVGNRPGVTVEVKSAKLNNRDNVTVLDLPGVYSLSPYTPEEVAARDCIVGRSGGKAPDVILNVADASNIERNLYLTVQLLETGLPLVLMLNMADAAEKKGIIIDEKKLSERLGVSVVKASAAKGVGLTEASQLAAEAASKKIGGTVSFFSEGTEEALRKIGRIIGGKVDAAYLRWYSVKLFERDEMVSKEIRLTLEESERIERIRQEREKIADDDSVGIIISERYAFAEKLAKECTVRQKRGEDASRRLDRILTGKFTALPCFGLIMTAVYFLSSGPLGGWLSKATGELVTEGGRRLAGSALDYIGCEQWLKGLICDGIIGGVGTVVGFLPQLAILFLMLALLEDWGYLSRVAFILDRFFRRFGLSGRSFIPMLIATGCGVPAIMSSRTVKDPAQRKATIITATFMPCGAKLPIISMVSSMFFGSKWWVAPICYFMGAAAVLLSGLLLKKLKILGSSGGEFIMELPDYRVPMAKNVLRSLWENCGGFLKRAGTTILLASAAIWFLSSFCIGHGGLIYTEDTSRSILRNLGEALAVFFKPIGFGNWQAAVASLMGLLAKEELAAVFGVLTGAGGMREVFAGSLEAFSFLIFNLLCAPCIAAVSAIGKEMGSKRWTAFALAYQTGFAYLAAGLIYWVGRAVLG